jgi:hypothetical protein
MGIAVQQASLPAQELQRLVLGAPPAPAHGPAPCLRPCSAPPLP